MARHARSIRLFSLLSLASALALTGCSASFSDSTPIAVAGHAIHGTFFGGQSPISGAVIYLYATSTTGYATGNTSLLDTTKPGVSTDGAGNGYVTTDSHGAFNISGDFACPTANTLVYLIAAGGNPGLGGNATNPMIAAITLLPACGSLSATTPVAINELTTVAAMEALAPFVNGTAVSTSPTNVLGLTNAFATASNLVNMSTGTVNATTPSGLGTIPVQEIDTLADILAACVNSDGTGTGCTTLMASATPPGGTAPTNTLQAMLNIARYPAQNVAALYNLVTAAAPFQPTLPATYNSFTNTYTGVPNDWTVAITYTNNTSLTSSTYLAIDSQSNIWVAGYNYTVVQLSNAGAINLSVMEPGGVGRSQLGTQNYDQDLAIDANDNLWVDNNSYGVSVVTKTGALITPDPWGYEPFGSGYVRGFGGLALDATGDIWIGSASNNASQLVEASSTGTGLYATTPGGGGIINPIFVAVDPAGNIWTANQGGSFATPNTVSELNPATGLFLSGAAGYASGGINTPSAIAFDAASNAWVSNYGGSSLTWLTPAGAAIVGSPFTGGGLKSPSDVAIDGAGNVWVSNWGGSGTSEFSGTTGAAITPALGYYRGVTGNYEGSVAIDSSGNVWTSSFAGYVSEQVGIAAPTINPIIVATKTGKIGTMP